MKKLLLIIIMFTLTSCSQKPYFIEDFVSEAFHQAIGLEKINDIKFLLNKDTIYVYPNIISLLDKTKILKNDSTIIPSHVDKWRIKVIRKDDLNGYIKTDGLWYLKLDVKEDEDNVTISLEKAIQYPDENKGMLDEKEGIKIFFKKINVPQITEISKYRNMYVVK